MLAGPKRAVCGHIQYANTCLPQFKPLLYIFSIRNSFIFWFLGWLWSKVKFGRFLQPFKEDHWFQLNDCFLDDYQSHKFRLPQSLGKWELLHSLLLACLIAGTVFNKFSRQIDTHYTNINIFRTFFVVAVSKVLNKSSLWVKKV